MTGTCDRTSTRAGTPARWHLWFLVAVLAGCGGDTGAARISFFPVKGQVLLPGDKPLTQGEVEFVGKDVLVSVLGKINSDGSFALGSSETREGAPAGEYQVKILPDSSFYAGSAKGKVLDRRKLPFDPKYLDESKSGLTVVVTSGTNQLKPFRLTKGDAK
jgi:hypothetical protein